MEENNWISVKERLPEEPGVYKTLLNNGRGFIWAELNTLCKGSEGVFWWDYLFITHWQPLPKAPTT